MTGRLYIYRYFLFGPLKKIIVRNSHSLLYARIINQHVHVGMLLGDPSIKFFSFRRN